MTLAKIVLSAGLNYGTELALPYQVVTASIAPHLVAQKMLLPFIKVEHFLLLAGIPPQVVPCGRWQVPGRFGDHFFVFDWGGAKDCCGPIFAHSARNNFRFNTLQEIQSSRTWQFISTSANQA